MIKKIFFLALGLAILSLTIHSEEKKEKSSRPSLEHEVVVTATRIETPSKEIASSVTVITSEDLLRMKKSTVLEVLQEVLGTSVIQNGGRGAASSLFLRGANSEHTLVLMDGVEINDPINPSRSCDLAHLSLENIDRIEVLRGPQSTLYGSDAIGGVVHIITRKGEGKPKFFLQTDGGSFESLSGSAGASGEISNIHYSFGLSYFKTQGISAASVSYPGNEEKDGYQNFSVSGRLGFSPRKNLEFDFVFRSLSAKTDIDNFGGAWGDDPNNVQDLSSLFLKGQARALFLGNRWEQKICLSLVRSNREHKNLEDSSHPFDQERGNFSSNLVKIDWQNNFFLLETNTLTFGLEYEQEEGQSEYEVSGIWGPFLSVFPSRRAKTLGFYLQDQIRLANQLFATVGVRLDSHSQSGQAITFRLAPAYFIEKTGTKFKATFGTGFKSPSLYQLYAPPTAWGPIGNEELKPEKSFGWEAGIEQQFFNRKFVITSTYFSNTYKDLITFDSLQGYINIGKAESKGVEMAAEVKPAKEFLFRASYTRMEARDKEKETYLLRRPRDKFVANLNWIFLRKWAVNLSFIYIGKRDDVDFSSWPYPQITLPGYTLLNGILSYDLNSRLQIFGRIDNILNEKYEMILGYGTQGFSAYGGIRVTF